MPILNWRWRPSWSAMTSKQKHFLIGIIVAVVGVVAYVSRGQQTNPRARGAQGDVVPVVAAAVKLADVPVYLDGVGTTRALNTVTVRAQVDGKLISVLFREGQDVKRGEVIARIDPTTY